MLTANSCKVAVPSPQKNTQYSLPWKGADVFRFEYWLDSICNGGDEYNDNYNDDYEDDVVSIILQVRAITSHERIQPGRERMSELKTNKELLAS